MPLPQLLALRLGQPAVSAASFHCVRMTSTCSLIIFWAPAAVKVAATVVEEDDIAADLEPAGNHRFGRTR